MMGKSIDVRRSMKPSSNRGTADNHGRNGIKLQGARSRISEGPADAALGRRLAGHMVGDADRLRAVSKVFLKFWSAADKQRPALPITRSRAEGCRRAAIPATGGRAHPPAKRACYRSRPASWPRIRRARRCNRARRCSSFFLSIISRPPRATVSALESLDRPGLFSWRSTIGRKFSASVAMR